MLSLSALFLSLLTLSRSAVAIPKLATNSLIIDALAKTADILPFSRCVDSNPPCGLTALYLISFETQAVSSTTAGLAPSAPGAGFLTITFSDAPVERADVWAFEFDGSSRFPLFIGAHSRRSLEFIGGLELVGVIEDMGHWEAFMEPVLKIDVRKELGAARPGEGVRAWVIDLLIDAWAFVGRATFNG